MTEDILTLAYLNIRGQSGLNKVKQLQIEAFAKTYNCDIMNLQEAHIEPESFTSCDFIQSSYNIIENNSLNKYGTASLVKSNLTFENVRNDTEGRVILFDIGGLSLGNVYLPSGTDARSRSDRENYFSDIIPNLLVNSKESGCIGGDFNCIVDHIDATHYPEAKMSRCLQRLINLKDWKDSFRVLHPASRIYSRYYESNRGEGATRIDRNYQFGNNLQVIEAGYHPLAFSDHFALIVKLRLENPISKILSPRSRYQFRLTPEVIRDKVFKENLEVAMISWQRVKEFQGGSRLGILQWWDMLVKPGIKQLGIQRSKDIRREKNEELNLLLLRQRNVKIKIQQGQKNMLTELKLIHLLIENWFVRENEKVQHQSRIQEFQENERSTLYHHEIHKKIVKRTSILKLLTDRGMIEGHEECASFLESTVEDLLLHQAQLDPLAQEVLLAEVVPVFTQEDNARLLTPPTNKEVLDTVSASNLLAAPGSDGLPSLLYKECWSVLGCALSDVMRAVFSGCKLPKSMRTSLMVFGSKPKKPNSILPGDKRKISLLNSDFKTASGIEAKRLKDTATHTLSPLQLVAGSDRRIHHGINLARNAIYVAGRPGHSGCGILDTDLVAAFDYLCMDWVFKVLEKKGMDLQVIERLQNLYCDSITVVMVNNIPGKVVKNIRKSLRQGDLPSMHFFGFGIDPLLIYLEKRLQGIMIASIPVQGPPGLGQPSMPPVQEKYIVIGYADDIKPAITSMQEFRVVDKAMSLFENASGCLLHRNPATKKCKFLPLGRWRGNLQQEDIPCPYMSLSDHLDMLGVELRATWSATRKVNGDICQTRVANTVKKWKTGKFMPITQRSWSLNQFCLPKVWFKTHSLDLRVLDVTKITSLVKSWLYQDQLLKPEEFVMHRGASVGGLGVHHVQLKAQAGLIRTFLETASNPSFRVSLFHSLLFRYHVLGETSLPDPGFPPFYSPEFFAKIRQVHLETPLNVSKMSEKEWYKVLLEDLCIMEVDREGNRQNKLCRVERMSPDTDWEESWLLARLPGLGSENISFLFKLIHDILPTQERVSRTNPRASSACPMPGCVTEVETRTHAFFLCTWNDGIGERVLASIEEYTPHVLPEQVLRLEFKIPEEQKLPIVWLLASVLNIVWNLRRSKSRVQLYEVRAQMEAKINLLRETRHSNAAIILDQIVTRHF